MTWLFVVLAASTLLGGLGVVLTRNVVHAALFLLMSLVSVAGIYLILFTEFLALVQVLIYGGAIIIVLVFAIMLTRTSEYPHISDNRQWPLAAIAALALGVVMFVQDWQLALVVLVTFPLVGVLIRNLGKRMRKVSTATQEETAKLASQLSETLEGARLVKAHGMEEGETQRIRGRIERRLKEIMRGIRARSAATPLTEALGGIAIALAIFYGGWRAQAGALSLGEFMSFLAALLMAYQPLKGLANLNTALQEGLAAAQRIFAILDVRPTIVDRPDAATLQIDQGEINYSAVEFSYDNETAALHGVDIHVPPGSTVALVGPSGAGKTTIAHLFMRFWDPATGVIELDGHNLRDYELNALRQRIALVAQDTYLFNDTLGANILIARPEATKKELAQALHRAALDEFIEGLPDGLETPVGERGMRLSGGQRQRVAIARAFLKDAPVLILDEATSHLDAVNEQLVRGALDDLMAERTTIVIAHRLSTVRDADHIVVLEAGNVIEQGSHDELTALGGLYAHLVARQGAAERSDAAE